MRARAIVVGGGIGGLSAAVRLALDGFDVTLLEKESAIGGKARNARVEGRVIAAGPTVLTMKHVFDELFDAAGDSFDANVRLTPLSVIARHFWSDGASLDLHADPAASADAIGRAFGRADAASFVRFLEDARRTYETVDRLFIRAQRPSLLGALGKARALGLRGISSVDGARTMDRALRGYFRSPRLRQLFGRYATYCGSSPFDAPATLNLVAYVESRGVHHVEGGMAALAEAVGQLARRVGVDIRTCQGVERVDVRDGRVAGVYAGTSLSADTVIWNGDVGALDDTVLGRAARRFVRPSRRAERSLSAVTFAGVCDPVGRELAYHNVFFSNDHEGEFRALFGQRRLPPHPTVYACADDRRPGGVRGNGEPVLLIVNSPATGDEPGAWQDPDEEWVCKARAEATVVACGVDLRMRSWETSTPRDFSLRFPGTGGALYGAASTGGLSAFQRPGARTRVRGLYLAGGSVHPGPGVPMACLSGSLAATAAREDMMPVRSRRAATAGSTSTV